MSASFSPLHLIMQKHHHGQFLPFADSLWSDFGQAGLEDARPHPKPPDTLRGRGNKNAAESAAKNAAVAA
jgi:hypothetical protein